MIAVRLKRGGWLCRACLILLCKSELVGPEDATGELVSITPRDAARTTCRCCGNCLDGVAPVRGAV